MDLLTKDQILAAEDRPSEIVEVPEWGGSVTVRTMSASERDAWEMSISEIKGDDVEFKRENVRAKLLAACLVDDQGELMFTPQEIPALGAKSAKVLNRLFEVAQRLNGIGKDDVEELTGN